MALLEGRCWHWQASSSLPMPSQSPCPTKHSPAVWVCEGGESPNRLLGPPRHCQRVDVVIIGHAHTCRKQGRERHGSQRAECGRLGGSQADRQVRQAGQAGTLQGAVGAIWAARHHVQQQPYRSLTDGGGQGAENQPVCVLEEANPLEASSQPAVGQPCSSTRAGQAGQTRQAGRQAGGQGKMNSAGLSRLHRRPGGAGRHRSTIQHCCGVAPCLHT